MHQNRHRFTMVTVALAGLFLSASSASAQAPVITGPGGYNVAVMWFLGPGNLSCCSGLTNKYYAQATVSVTNPSGDPTPTVAWFTDTPGSVTITSPGPGGVLTAELTATAPSTHTTYDINVWATVDGVRTAANLQVFNDTPAGPSNGGPVNQPGACQAQGYATGYITYVSNSILDLTGSTALTKIDLNETLENKIATGSWPLPTASSWTVSNWSTSTTYIDQLSICGPASGPSPQMTNYNYGVGALGFSETQKFWVGSLTHYSGECVSIDDVQLFAGYPTQTKWQTPGSTPAQQTAACAMGNTIINP